MKTAAHTDVSPWHDVAARMLSRLPPEGAVASFLITSCTRGEGKSTMCREIATLAAQGGRKVGVLDIRSPAPADGVALAGRTEPLEFKADPARGYARLGLPASFTALPTMGPAPRDWIRGFDLLLIDGPPVGTFMQQHLSALVDGVALVVHSRKRRLAEVTRAAKIITDDGGRLLGVVLNRHRSPLPRWLDLWGDRP